MTTYLALLRGINVGGKSLINMADLKNALAKAGLQDVSTYIQNGNVIFKSKSADKLSITKKIVKTIQASFDLAVDVIVLTADEWKTIIKAAPKWWGMDTSWKHNMIVMTSEFDMQEVMAEIGDLKPEIEKVEPGLGVIYQSLSFEKFGRTTSGKIASNPIYKHMTVRNYNTTTKLVTLLDQS